MYSLDNLERHWRSTCRSFDDTFADCVAVFREMFRCASPICSALAGRKALEPNCVFVLLTKVLNHASATFVLLQRGLLVDAALTSRNAVETSLLLELLAKEPSLCGDWSRGKSFRPSDVRRRLAKLPSVALGELIVDVTPDEYEDTRFGYDWMSRITHANVESVGHAAQKHDANIFELKIGGALSRPEIIAVTKVLGTCYLRAILTCAAAYAPELLQREMFDELTRRLHDVKVGARA
jgi:hypothetical protein